MEIKEHGVQAEEIQTYFEYILDQSSKVWAFTWNTPPHDLARRIMNNINEFQSHEEGGAANEQRDTTNMAGGGQD